MLQWGDGRQRLYAEPVYTAPGFEKLPWFVVIHGGAWRDPKITYETGFMALKLAKLSQKFGGIVSLDYRLSPEVQHPAHMQDVIQGLERVIQKYDPHSFVILGHSCGAFLAGQVYPHFSQKITKIIGLEGIYDLELLVQEYPGYASFVEPAFGSDRDKWPAVDWSVVPLTIVHSRKDELLSMQQPKWASQFVQTPMKVLDKGRHDEVLENFRASLLDL